MVTSIDRKVANTFLSAIPNLTAPLLNEILASVGLVPVGATFESYK